MYFLNLYTSFAASTQCNANFLVFLVPLSLAWTISPVSSELAQDYDLSKAPGAIASHHNPSMHIPLQANKLEVEIHFHGGADVVMVVDKE